MPFKDKLKQLLYMRKYQAKRRAERKKQEQLHEAHVQAIKIMRKNFIGRVCIPVKPLPQDAKDVPQEMLLPVIQKNFELGNLESLVKATLAVVEEEDKLLLIGEHKGWPALGIHGLATTPNHQIVKFNETGDLVNDSCKAVEKAHKKLRSKGYFPPYTLVLNEDYYPIITWPDLASENLVQILYSPVLCNGECEKNNALLVKCGADNFEVVIGQDLSISPMPDNQAKLWEALTPVIHKPSSICEITDITY